MKVFGFVLVMFFLMGNQWTVWASGLDPREVEFFEKKIRPVLVEHCYSCHSQEAQGKKKPRGGFLVDSRKALLQGGDSGPGLVPGKARESLLYQALLHEKDLRMPPKGKLPQAVIDDFARWIDRGAIDPRDGNPVIARKQINLAEGRKFWSLQPIQSPSAPVVTDASWPRSNIDRFLLARLEEKGLKPAPDAEMHTLIRRIYFDLIGLPPTPEQVEAFFREKNPNTLERVVDDLLASPQFGERWGRHWLDVARFAESNGRARNMVWHHAWRYRDWVIQAMQRDMPFDEFLRAQIAGDLLPVKESSQRDAQLIATGFLALGPKSLEETKRESFRMDMIDEQIDVISKGFLGLTVSCARCHDHKFDPIPTREYYALAGILRSTQTLYGLGPMGIRGINDSILQILGSDPGKLAQPAAEHLEKLKIATQQRNDARSDRYRVVRKVADLKTQLARPNAAQVTIQQDIDRLEAEIKKWDEKVKDLEGQVRNQESNPPAQPDFAMAAREMGKPEDCRIHVRGETTNLGEVVPRGVLQVISLADLGPIGPEESGRKQLADWLAHPANPLPARVAVNRIWLHLFGRGLVATPDDFGFNGARPSHPELLDHLASRFIAEGWSTKKMIRSIVLSRAYQLGSEVSEKNQEIDPDNIYLWRWRPKQLEAEALRDAVLAVSGQLERSPLAKSVVAQLHPFKEPEFNGFALALKPEQQEHRHRSVYLPIVRGFLPEFLKLFDYPDPSVLTGQREETVVPAQASFLMNSPWIIAQARHTAQRLVSSFSSDDQRVDNLYLLALARLPSKMERERALEYLHRSEERLPASKDSPSPEGLLVEKWTSLCQVLLASAEFRYLF